MGLSLKNIRKEEGMGDICYSTAGHGGEGEDEMSRERMSVAATKRGKWATSFNPQKDENSSKWEPACFKIF